MVNRYVMKSELDLFIYGLPYEWRSGTSDGLFLPIYPPRGMHVVLGFWWLVDFCNKYVSSLWLMLSPRIIRTLTLPPLLASLVPRNFRRCHKPTIYLPQNSHHTYVLWHFHSHSKIYLPCNLPPFRLLWHASSLSYCFTWSCSWHRICGKDTFIILSYMSLMSHCTSRYTAGGIHIKSYFVLSIEL